MTNVTDIRPKRSAKAVEVDWRMHLHAMIDAATDQAWDCLVASQCTVRPQLFYRETRPGQNGRLAVGFEGQEPGPDYLPVHGALARAAALTKDQIRTRIREAAWRLPILPIGE